MHLACWVLQILSSDSNFKRPVQHSVLQELLQHTYRRMLRLRVAEVLVVLLQELIVNWSEAKLLKHLPINDLCMKCRQHPGVGHRLSRQSPSSTKTQAAPCLKIPKAKRSAQPKWSDQPRS